MNASVAASAGPVLPIPAEPAAPPVDGVLVLEQHLDLPVVSLGLSRHGTPPAPNSSVTADRAS
jgi:hypothetical protein